MDAYLPKIKTGRHNWYRSSAKKAIKKRSEGEEKRFAVKNKADTE